MTKARKPKRATFGPVKIIAALLLCSALLRVGLAAPAVWAAVGETLPKPDQAMPADAAQHQAPQSCTTPPDLARVLQALQERERAADTREAEIEARLATLDAREREVEAKTREMQRAEQALADTMALSDRAAEDDLARLTLVYEQMKPKNAAALFETMTPDFASGFLGRMKPGNAAGILAAMDPQTAYAMSVILAGRNANAGNVSPNQ